MTIIIVSIIIMFQWLLTFWCQYFCQWKTHGFNINPWQLVCAVFPIAISYFISLHRLSLYLSFHVCGIHVDRYIFLHWLFMLHVIFQIYYADDGLNVRTLIYYSCIDRIKYTHSSNLRDKFDLSNRSTLYIKSCSDARWQDWAKCAPIWKKKIRKLRTLYKKKQGELCLFNLWGIHNYY